jgi:hypothetical protein
MYVHVCRAAIAAAVLVQRSCGDPCSQPPQQRTAATDVAPRLPTHPYTHSKSSIRRPHYPGCSANGLAEVKDDDHQPYCTGCGSALALDAGPGAATVGAKAGHWPLQLHQPLPLTDSDIRTPATSNCDRHLRHHSLCSCTATAPRPALPLLCTATPPSPPWPALCAASGVHPLHHHIC